MRASLVLPVCVLALLCSGADAIAQPLPFGSGEAVFERGSDPTGADGLRLGLFAGPAYLDGWRTAVYAEGSSRAGRLSGGLAGALHPGPDGLYRGEADHLDDLLRTLHLRLDPAPGDTVQLYARVGPTERITLGSGVLARDFSSGAAPDEQPLGAEAAFARGPLWLAAFASDVTRGGVVGGEARWTTGRAVGPVVRAGATLAVVHDTARPTPAARRLSGAEVMLHGELVGDGETFAVGPFASLAGYAGRGQALGGGLDARATSLGDAVTARARVAVFGASAQFVPGHVGPFYRVAGGASRIVDADSFYDPEPSLELAGTPLDSLRGSVSVVVDVRAVVFGRAEIAQHVRRHVGADRASAWGVRAALRLPGSVRAELSVERQGFRGLWGLLFGGLGEENRLVLDVGAPVGPVHVLIRSRYGYRRLSEADAPGEAGPRYLIERRFEPMAGVRLAW